MAIKPKDLELGKGYRYGWHDESTSLNEPKRGLSADVVEEISRLKDEPEWMKKFRLKAYRYFMARPMPNWGGARCGDPFQKIFSNTTPPRGEGEGGGPPPRRKKKTLRKAGAPQRRG